MLSHLVHLHRIVHPVLLGPFGKSSVPRLVYITQLWLGYLLQ
jgi:hypothetical protein